MAQSTGTNSDPIRRLCKASELGFKKLSIYRKARWKMMAQYVGPFYSKNKVGGDLEEKKATPINLMYNGITTMVPNLVFNDPRAKVSTDVLPYRQYGNVLELAINHVVRKMRLRQSLRKVITDALMSCGIVKVGIGVSGQTLELDGMPHDIGEPYAERVDLDDFTIDPMARDWEEAAFMGNRVRIAKEHLLASGLYPNDKIEKLASRYNQGQWQNELSNLGGDHLVNVEFNNDVTEYVDLVEIYIPSEQIVVTIPWRGEQGGGPDDVIRIVDYNGPERGPYHMLGFAWAPDNVFPVAPASLWYYLHILGNRIARKIARQAERMKRILAYEPSAVEDAQSIKDADDGETLKVEAVDKVKEVNYGGTTEDAYQYMEWVKREFSQQAGNIDLLGGTAADQPTATQSEMLQSNTQVRVQDMQQIVYTFTGEIITDLGKIIHEDPLIDLTLVRRAGGVDQQVRYTPEMREGTFFDYHFSVYPYSMARQDPNVQLKRIMEFISNGIPAIAQAFQLLGPALNVEGAVNLVLDKMGIEERDEIINSQMLQMRIQQMMAMMPPDGKLGGAGGGGGAAPPALPGGGRPEQPNPGQMTQNGGVMPDQERNAQQQETAGMLQATYI